LLISIICFKVNWYSFCLLKSAFNTLFWIFQLFYFSALEYLLMSLLIDTAILFIPWFLYFLHSFFLVLWISYRELFRSLLNRSAIRLFEGTVSLNCFLWVNHSFPFYCMTYDFLKLGLWN
jgi:hypothetical protein